MSSLPPAQSLIIGAELPENSPRYVVLSYELNFDDGRKSFPLVLINWAPSTSEISACRHYPMLLPSDPGCRRDDSPCERSPHIPGNRACTPGSLFVSLIPFSQAGVSKVIEMREGPEALTKEAIDAKLNGR